MGNGYTRQSSAQIVDTEIISAGPLNNEFNSLRDAFDGSSGHTHDGTSGESQKIPLKTSVAGILPIENGGTNSNNVQGVIDQFNILTKAGGTITGSLITTGEGFIVQRDGYANFWFKDSAGNERGLIYLEPSDGSMNFRMAGDTLPLVLSKSGNVALSSSTGDVVFNCLNGETIKGINQRVIAAQNRADVGVSNAANAQSKADTAYNNAATAQSRADSAYNNAGTAQSRADAAFTNAGTAQNRADAAYSNAETRYPKTGGVVNGDVRPTGVMYIQGDTVGIQRDGVKYFTFFNAKGDVQGTQYYNPDNNSIRTRVGGGPELALYNNGDVQFNGIGNGEYISQIQSRVTNAQNSANSANNNANTRVLKTGDTMTGNLTVPFMLVQNNNPSIHLEYPGIKRVALYVDGNGNLVCSDANSSSINFYVPPNVNVGNLISYITAQAEARARANVGAINARRVSYRFVPKPDSKNSESQANYGEVMYGVRYDPSDSGGSSEINGCFFCTLQIYDPVNGWRSFDA